jgi:hypothetical protein
MNSYLQFTFGRYPIALGSGDGRSSPGGTTMSEPGIHFVNVWVGVGCYQYLFLCNLYKGRYEGRATYQWERIPLCMLVCPDGRWVLTSHYFVSLVYKRSGLTYYE